MPEEDRSWCHDLPLHQTALDPDEAWGVTVRMPCACGQTMGLWDKRCAACRTRNPFRKLLRKRSRIERWIDRQIERDMVDKLQQANKLLDHSRSFDSSLVDALSRPFPERLKDEELNRFLKRVMTFFQSTFKTTSPARAGRMTYEAIERAGAAMARVACTEPAHTWLQLWGCTPLQVPEAAIARQSEKLHDDLMQLAGPYLKALQTLQLYHTRMLAAYAPARKIMRRDYSAGRSKTIWDKARALVSPAGRLVRFGTAIWENAEEREQMQRFDTEVTRFYEQVPWFQAQHQQLLERSTVLVKTIKLSLRKHQVRCLARHLAIAEPKKRGEMIRRVLAQKGVGSWLWRWLFSRR